MRIAQIAPLYERVPPVAYGGTERVVSFITEALVERGHEVTLFASGDSITKADLQPQTPHSLRMANDCIDALAHHVAMMEPVARQAESFDIIHSHIDYPFFPLIRRLSTPVITTLHGRLDLKDLQPVYREFDDIPLVSISDAQRTSLPWVRWIGTVHHGLPAHLFSFHPEAGDYAAFIGRASPEKGLLAAIEIARQSEIPLKIAAKVDKVDAEYFSNRILPLLDHPLVEFVGEIGDAEKNDFIGNARALLSPIDWPEPFGLVFIESMACGTPIITTPRGAAPEIVEPGVSGFLVHSIQEAVEALRNISDIRRSRCRQAFEQRFTSDRMVSDYLALYRKILDARVVEDVVTGPLEEPLRGGPLGFRIRTRM